MTIRTMIGMIKVMAAGKIEPEVTIRKVQSPILETSLPSKRKLAKKERGIIIIERRVETKICMLLRKPGRGT